MCNKVYGWEAHYSSRLNIFVSPRKDARKVCAKVDVGGIPMTVLSFMESWAFHIVRHAYACVMLFICSRSTRTLSESFPGKKTWHFEPQQSPLSHFTRPPDATRIPSSMDITNIAMNAVTGRGQGILTHQVLYLL